MTGRSRLLPADVEVLAPIAASLGCAVLKSDAEAAEVTHLDGAEPSRAFSSSAVSADLAPDVPSRSQVTHLVVGDRSTKAGSAGAPKRTAKVRRRLHAPSWAHRTPILLTPSAFCSDLATRSLRVAHRATRPQITMSS